MRTKVENAARMRIAYAREREQLNADYLAREHSRGGWTQDAYSKFLQLYYWEFIFMVSFRIPRSDPYYASKAVWSELRKYNVSRAFIGVEPHQSGDLHLHGLAAGNIRGWLPEIALPWDIWPGLFKRFGRSSVQAVNSPEAVSNYCAKEVLKQQSRVCDYYDFYGRKFAWQQGLINLPEKLKYE
jgi:hypothetical protein